MTLGTQTKESDEVLAGQVLSAIDTPPEITKLWFRFDPNEAGDLDLTVYLRVAEGAIKGREDIRTITEFTDRLQSELLRAGISRFPYVLLDEAS